MVFIPEVRWTICHRQLRPFRGLILCVERPRTQKLIGCESRICDVASIPPKRAGRTRPLLKPFGAGARIFYLPRTALNTKNKLRRAVL